MSVHSDDTYRNKRTNEKVPEERIIEMIDPNEHDDDSSSDSETTSDDEYPEDIGYWDPISNTYRSKRTKKVIPEERMTDDYDSDEDDTDPGVKSETATNTGPLSEMEY